MLTLPQSGGNHVSEDLKLKHFRGRVLPEPPTGVPPSEAPFLRTPSPKIPDPRQHLRALSYVSGTLLSVIIIIIIIIIVHH